MVKNKSLNQLKLSDYSEYILWSQRTEIKYNLHYGWCTGRLFTASTWHNTSCSEVKINLKEFHITNCKAGISFNDFLYFGNDFFTRSRFWPTWFRCIFDGPYTRLKFLFPPPNCDIRHTTRSINSHQLSQRTTKFWASLDVSLYFIFLVDASTNRFYCSGQCMRVFKWQILS